MSMDCQDRCLMPQESPEDSEPECAKSSRVRTPVGLSCGISRGLCSHTTAPGLIHRGCPMALQEQVFSCPAQPRGQMPQVMKQAIVLLLGWYTLISKCLSPDPVLHTSKIYFSEMSRLHAHQKTNLFVFFSFFFWDKGEVLHYDMKFMINRTGGRRSVLQPHAMEKVTFTLSLIMNYYQPTSSIPSPPRGASKLCMLLKNRGAWSV